MSDRYERDRAEEYRRGQAAIVELRELADKHGVSACYSRDRSAIFVWIDKPARIEWHWYLSGHARIPETTERDPLAFAEALQRLTGFLADERFRPAMRAALERLAPQRREALAHLEAHRAPVPRPTYTGD